MEYDFVTMLNQSVTWHKFSGENSQGEVSYAASKTLACHIQGFLEAVLDTTGRKLVSYRTIYFDGTSDAATFTKKDKFKLPDGTYAVVQSVEPCYDEIGNLHHVEVIIK